MYRIGIDVGGTFTDLVAVDERGRVTLAKAASTPRDPSIGVHRRAHAPRRGAGQRARSLLARDRAHRPRHDRRDQRAARAQGRARRAPDDRGAPRRDRDARGAQGRPLQPPHAAARAAGAARPAPRACGSACAPTGAWRRALDRRSLDRAIADLRRDGVEAVAVCYLHAYRDARHERATARRARRALPGVYVSLSSEVLPQIKEYERVCTTVVNAYVGPVLSRYLSRLAERLARGGLRRPRPHHAVPRRRGAGGRRRAPRRRGRPVRPGRRRRGEPLLRAAPRGGEPHPLRHGRHQHRHLADRARRGPPRRRTGRSPARRSPCRASTSCRSAPAADRSRAWTPAGSSGSGRESAGAEPGPACYGKGGTAATVTDANLRPGLSRPRQLPGRPDSARPRRRAGGRRRDRGAGSAPTG